MLKIYEIPAEHYIDTFSDDYAFRTDFFIPRAGMDSFKDAEKIDAGEMVGYLAKTRGGSWKSGAIRGCVQGAFSPIYYRSECESEIDDIERSFFRLNYQWRSEDQDGFDIFAETETDEKAEIADAFDVSPEEIAVYRVRGWQPVFAEG